MRDAKLTRNDARTNAGGGKLDDLEANVVGKRSAVDEYTAKLVDSSLTCKIEEDGGMSIVDSLISSKDISSMAQDNRDEQTRSNKAQATGIVQRKSIYRSNIYVSGRRPRLSPRKSNKQEKREKGAKRTQQIGKKLLSE